MIKILFYIWGKKLQASRRQCLILSGMCDTYVCIYDTYVCMFDNPEKQSFLIEVQGWLSPRVPTGIKHWRRETF